MKETIRHRQEFIISGYELKTTTLESKHFNSITKFWIQKKQKIMNIIEEGIKQKYYAIYGVYAMDEKEDFSFSYLICTESQLNSLSKGIVKIKVPEASYAVFTVESIDKENISQEYEDMVLKMWRYIYESWFPNSNYEYDEGKLEFEQYNIDESTGGFFSVDIYIPIKNRI